MGTKLGNLHIRNASLEEVSALLPGALVGQWGEGFVSVYHEDYHLGMVEREGQKLSRKLPTATVLTAAIFDSDVVNFEVYQAGKRLTAHLLDPYENVNKMGNLKVFCEALGLPPEDEKRLKVVWKKGDAEEQMDLTATLLGLPLTADVEWSPKEKTVRDTAPVDAWIVDHPDPPKVKSVTKATLAQEFSQVRLNHSSDHTLNLKDTGFFAIDEVDYRGMASKESLYRIAADGLLEFMAGIEVDSYAVHLWRDYFMVAPDRVWGIQTLIQRTSGLSDNRSWELLFDSKGSFPTLKGDDYVIRCKVLPDGGAWVATNGEVSRFHADGSLLWTKSLYVEALTEDRFYVRGSAIRPDPSQPPVYDLSCYDADGVVCGTWTLSRNSDLIKIDSRGDLWISEDLGRRLLHLDKDLNLLARSDPFDIRYGVLDVTQSPDGETVLCTVYKDSIYVLNGTDLSLRQRLRTKDACSPVIDGKGRFWVLSGDSTAVAYDRDLRMVSRHRLKGDIVSMRCNEAGELMVYTSDEKNCIFRVYHIS